MTMKKSIPLFWAVLGIFLVTTLFQGYFTWKGINSEKENRERIEVNVENAKVEQLKEAVASVVNNQASAFEMCIDSAERVRQQLLFMMRQNPEILGCAVAYLPTDSPTGDSLYAPYAYRDDETIKFKILSYDYTLFDWYLNVARHMQSGWSRPYVDMDGTFVLMSTYSLPLRDDNGQFRAVLTADLPMSELGQATGSNHKVSVQSIAILCMQLLGILLILFIVWKAVQSMKHEESVSNEKQLMKAELKIASNLQGELLPKSYPKHPRLDMSASLQTAKTMSGDFYDYVLEDNQLCFCIGDVATHGLGSILGMVATRTAYHVCVRHKEQPTQVMESINQYLKDIQVKEMYATLFIGQLDLATGRLCYCNAGHLMPYLLKNGEAAVLEVTPNVPLGLSEWNFEQHELQLHPGDVLFLYTDGTIENMNQNKDSFGEKKLLLHVRRAAEQGDHPEELLKRVRTALQRHIGNEGEVIDDVTMLAIEYKA